jgi:hypothetical protein
VQALMTQELSQLRLTISQKTLQDQDLLQLLQEGLRMLVTGCLSHEQVALQGRMQSEPPVINRKVKMAAHIQSSEYLHCPTMAHTRASKVVHYHAVILHKHPWPPLDHVSLIPPLSDLSGLEHFRFSPSGRGCPGKLQQELELFLRQYNV